MNSTRTLDTLVYDCIVRHFNLRTLRLSLQLRHSKITVMLVAVTRAAMRTFAQFLKSGSG
jgi:hypothetical protein